MVPYFCPSCDATEKPFRLIQRTTEQEFRGETLRVTSPALQCRHCSFGLLGPGHLDALRVATHDTYRRQHGLLTSGEFVLPGVGFVDGEPELKVKKRKSVGA